MFHLPREIIQLIFEFDPTYREEYNKTLQLLKRLPAYYQYVPTLEGEPYLYMFSLVYPMRHYYPPSKFYFHQFHFFILF